MYLSLILDFLVCTFLPINTYFIIVNLDEQRIPKIIVVGLLLDFLYRRVLCLTIILLVLHLLIKHTKHLKNHKILKNIFLFLIFFMITFYIFGHNDFFLPYLIIGLILNSIYLFFIEKLLK